MASVEPKDSCALCAHEFRRCPHPWDKPFEHWPAHQLNKLQALVPQGSGK